MCSLFLIEEKGKPLMCLSVLDLELGGVYFMSKGYSWW